MYFTDRLIEMKSDEYAAFQAKIINNIESGTILGIRIPKIKKLAKELYEKPEKTEFFKELPHKYFEENLLHIMLITLEKDFDKCIDELETFLPYADNWAVTDQTVPKCFKKNHEKVLPIIEKWLKSDHTYTARYAMIIYMKEFLDDDFDKKYLDMISRKRGEDYYLKMMIAWYFATALAKQYDATIPYIENKKLEKWTHNKAIQKSIESFRVSDEHKEYLRTLKVK